MSIADELLLAGLPVIDSPRQYGTRHGCNGVEYRHVDSPARDADGVNAAVKAGASFYVDASGRVWVLADGRLGASPTVLVVVAGDDTTRSDALTALDAVLTAAYASPTPSAPKRKKAAKKAVEPEPETDEQPEPEEPAE